MKRLMSKLLLLMPIPAMVLAANYTIDPAHLFGGGAYERGVAEWLLKGAHVAYVSNYDERLVQKYYVEGLSVPPEILILGSSRCLQIGSWVFPGRRVFNHSVAGATLEDDLAVYGLYRFKGLQPARVILGVDPWVFNKANYPVWSSLGPEAKAMAHALTSAGKPAAGRWRLPARYRALCSLSYFQESAKLGTAWLRAAPEARRRGYTVSDETVDDGLTKRPDGSLSYARSFRSRSPEEVRQDAIAYVSRDSVYGLDSFTQLDPETTQLFESFIEMLQQDGVEVWLVLPPYHPVTYALLIESPQYRIVADVQQYLEQVAQKKHLVLLGGYDSGALHLTDADFLDGMHPTASAMARLITGADAPSHEMLASR